MNLVCPHCQKLLTVPDQNAGQTTSCPYCNQKFLVPSLPQSFSLPPLHDDLPIEISLAPEPAAPDPPSVQAPGQPEHEEPVYKVSAEPPKPKPIFSTQEAEEISNAPAKRPAAPSTSPRPAAPPPPIMRPPPGDYTHSTTLTLNPRALPPLLMISVALLFFMLFFPWTGVYPGGYGIYTQNAFYQIWWGSYSTDYVGDKALGGAKPFDSISGNWLMFFYLLLLLLALALAFAPLVVTHGSLTLPARLQPLWPWRMALLGGTLALALLILLVQSWVGFGIERAVSASVDASLATQREGAKTPEEREIVNIQRAMQIDRFGVQRTVWYRLAVFLQVLALVSIALEIWMERRGTRPVPRADFHW